MWGVNLEMSHAVLLRMDLGLLTEAGGIITPSDGSVTKTTPSLLLCEFYGNVCLAASLVHYTHNTSTVCETFSFWDWSANSKTKWSRVWTEEQQSSHNLSVWKLHLPDWICSYYTMYLLVYSDSFVCHNGSCDSNTNILIN